jgi:2',3'-cyclic-nucleotide 2'-phosphodiesterase (5'-nucleotidase family)
VGAPLFDLGDEFAAKIPIPEEDRAREELRADLILRAMARQGTSAFVPGERDLALGFARLAKAAAELKLPLVSANLRPVTGDNPFVSHVEVSAGELRVCAVGMNGEENYGPEVVRDPDTAKIARAELQSLADQHCDLKILLAHMDRAELDKLLFDAPGFDAAVFGHQGQQYLPQHGEIVVFGDGQRGRQVGVIQFGLAEGSVPGHLADKGEAEKLRVNEKQMQKEVSELEKRIGSATEPVKTASEKQLASIRTRLAEVQSKIPAAEHKRDPRVYAVDWVNLGTDVADDEKLKTEVDAFQKEHPEPAPAPQKGPRPTQSVPNQLPPHPVFSSQIQLPNNGQVSQAAPQKP